MTTQRKYKTRNDKQKLNQKMLNDIQNASIKCCKSVQVVLTVGFYDHCIYFYSLFLLLFVPHKMTIYSYLFVKIGRKSIKGPKIIIILHKHIQKNWLWLCRYKKGFVGYTLYDECAKCI